MSRIPNGNYKPNVISVPLKHGNGTTQQRTTQQRTISNEDENIYSRYKFYKSTDERVQISIDNCKGKPKYKTNLKKAIDSALGIYGDELKLLTDNYEDFEDFNDVEILSYLVDTRDDRSNPTSLASSLESSYSQSKPTFPKSTPKSNPSYPSYPSYQPFSANIYGNSGNWPIRNANYDCLVEAFMAYLYFIPNDNIDNEMNRIIGILTRNKNSIIERRKEDSINKRRIGYRIEVLTSIKEMIKVFKQFGDINDLNNITHTYAKMIKTADGVDRNYPLEADVIFGANVYYCDSYMPMIIDKNGRVQLRYEQKSDSDILAKPIEHRGDRIYIEVLNKNHSHFYCIVNIKGELYEIESLNGGTVSKIREYPLNPIMAYIELDQKYEREIQALINRFNSRWI